MATASTQEVRAAIESLRRLGASIAIFLCTVTLADVAPMRGGKRTRVGHVLWG
ncbi:hypothetical protein ACFO5R_05030 [Halosolutus amylolyticus]|uniref:Uncharacterized protein n=1 Tax=Halosolutus amylolyticus TaxID=2932267 RepID=A0ABD5PL83_9EURY|nr:hypothetical protein [Halosolutus amylolyticus]